MWFPREKHARWARHVAEEMIKLVYAELDRDAPSWVAEAEKCPSLSARYLAFRHEAAAYPLDPDRTALNWLRRDRTMLIIERCQDISRFTGIECAEDLFPQLCCAYVLRFPQVPFTALYRHEMTVTGAIQLLRVRYDGKLLHIQEKNGMWPMDEDDWSREFVYDYAAEDGYLVKKGYTDPMKDVKDRRAAAAARALDAVERLCCPLLVYVSGSIAYGVDTPESDVDVRGIFINEREEWIGLREERESVRLEDSDTMLYGLRKAMKLLLACNPNVVELLGLRKQDILYATAEGRQILEAAPAFLSRRAIFTFGAYATNLRRQIQKRIDAGKPDRKAIGKEMMHLIRIYDMGGDLLENGRVTTYRQDTQRLLMRIRAGEYQDRHGMPTADYERLLENFMGAFNAAAVRTSLPTEPDFARVNALTMEIARKAL